jgi:tyrosine-protein kinase Etk/Wzc
MNPPLQQPLPANPPDDNEIDLAGYLDILFDNRWLIASIMLVVTLLGVANAFMTRPVYQAKMLIQVEDSPGSAKSIFGEMPMFDSKAATSAEIEIIRSRMIVARAVDNLQLYISASPIYFPVIGAWLAGRNKELSEPGLLGYGGYVWGAEKINVTFFNVPEALEGAQFVLTAGVDGNYKLTQEQQAIALEGRMGATLKANVAGGAIGLLVDSFSAKPGAQFLISASSRLAATQGLQSAIVAVEQGKGSGFLGVTLEGGNAKLTSDTLNEIGREYVLQNVERKSEQAEKTLIFLDKQLPKMKTELEKSETTLNEFRKASGTIDLTVESSMLLGQSVAAQATMTALKQKREELLIRFTVNHPTVQGVDSQVEEINAEMQRIAESIKKLPLLEQDVLRLTRDVKINTDLYIALLNSAQQLRLVKAGMVGNVRLIDAAVVPGGAIKPNRPVMITISVLLGLFMGVVCAFIRKSLFGGIEDAHEIEKTLGLTVYASIPYSKEQEVLHQQMMTKSKKISVLAQVDSHDRSIESLRSLRTALQFSMLDAINNIILITGPTPAMGKSFISVNFAAVLAAAGKKVLLIDGDLRKGHLHQYLGLERKNGLSDLIAAGCSHEQAVHKGVIDNVDFIGTGTLPPKPSELLMHKDMGTLLAGFAESYDYVLIDTAPVLAVSDTLILGSHAGAVFMVARAGISSMGDIKESVKRCSQAGIPIKGVIFNGVMHRPGGYGYGYGRYRYAEYNY